MSAGFNLKTLIKAPSLTVKPNLSAVAGINCHKPAALAGDTALALYDDSSIGTNTKLSGKGPPQQAAQDFAPVGRTLLAFSIFDFDMA